MNEVNVLYILGTGSLFGNEELRYSLRSVDKFGKNVGRVFITGECPDFVDKSKVTFLPELDIGKPMINHWWKVDQTFRKTDIGEKALLMYDDIFFCESVDLSTYPWQWRGDLPEEKPIGEYRRSLFNARTFLFENNLPVYDYECHTPCIYEKSKFIQLEKFYNELKLDDSAMAVRSVYANMFANPEKRIDDLKIRSVVDSVDNFVKGRDCFSIADDCFEGPVEEWLKKTFPERSRWEK